MIFRVIILVLALIALGVLLYLQRPESGGSATTAAQAASAEPGFVAIGAELIETGDDGKPLYRLDADRISQPTPDGLIYLTAPILHYQPPGASPWVLTARQGELPQNAHVADLRGAVHAEGKPQGSNELMRMDTDTLHVDMQQQLATTPAVVHLHWAGSLLTGRGMHANLKTGRLVLMREVSGVLAH
ncbi:MAG TPA: LPS export ABC transporter periplasmic protein LptC [Steroidobacteraceae bacterium]|jgi:LPS export ABC transporter protein LptC|nr:LPS export ABC transporter periplasmic protein LptC [Steroidobacteraceae bacterium]